MGDLGISDAFSGITINALLEALLLVVLASILIMLVQKLLPRVAETLGGKPRLYLLASVPLVRLLVIVATIILVVPVLVEPSFENMIAIFGALGLALGFAFKDYANSLIAGIVTLYEMPYRPGDWIEVNGQYGEVKSIGTRSAEIVTPDDNVVIIPHSTLWTALIANGNDGSDNLMCVAEFHVEPHHEVSAVLSLLRDVAYTSPLVKTWQPVSVTVRNTPHGMQYKVKAYPLAPREQFRFITDLTARGAEALASEGVRMVSVPVAAA
ncbi:mechanosensitive ion channel family protein [Marinobacter sp. NP-4(2019)]|uniref:mechanosensitive ion channel family protein n=1 Tax=Marinobacter sp. NP-4(2019) TaxID=2488665 RepID=UPI000FC3D469|nr:mechanosensitive ion channel domain-containing protein [Marinobacter sp. NP-4(2019)]AZT84700.1 mechanosensitive ion channel family protein [Marinobacter sp. NP-4(2019)]